MRTVAIPLHGRDGEIRAWALIDESDYDEVAAHSWHLLSSGYAARSIWGEGRNEEIVLMQRSLLGLGRGDKRRAHHRNEDRLDNRRSNLQIVTTSEHSRLHSQFTGVTFFKRTGRWMARTRKREGRYVHLGYFATRDEALRAVAKAEGALCH